MAGGRSKKYPDNFFKTEEELRYWYNQYEQGNCNELSRAAQAIYMRRRRIKNGDYLKYPDNYFPSLSEYKHWLKLYSHFGDRTEPARAAQAIYMRQRRARQRKEYKDDRDSLQQP